MVQGISRAAFMIYVGLLKSSYCMFCPSLVGSEGDVLSRWCFDSRYARLVSIGAPTLLCHLQDWSDHQEKIEVGQTFFRSELGKVYKRVVAKHRETAQAARRGRGKKQRAAAPEQKWPLSDINMTEAHLQELMPQATRVIVSKDIPNQRWLARWAGVFSCSRSWALHTPHGAALQVAREVWRSHLYLQGLSEKDCEIQGLFDNGQR